MERRKQKKLHLLGGEERLQAERDKMIPYYAKYFTYQILAVCCKIPMENYGEIHVRNTRLEKFTELYGRGLEMLGEDKSTEQYLEYIEQYGLHINWKEPET
jgi:hypothetical protein